MEKDENNGQGNRNEPGRKDLEVLEEKDENVPEDNVSISGGKQEVIQEKENDEETKVENVESKVKDGDTSEKNKMNNHQNEQEQKADQLEKNCEGLAEEEEKKKDQLEVPNIEEQEIIQLEDPDKEKKEKEEKIMTDYKNLAFPKRPRSMIKSELLVKDVKKFIEDMKKQTAPEDLDIRIIPTNMACRFELPIDLTRLKGECPLSYLRKYCRVTDSRRTVYREKFEQYTTDQVLTVSNLQKIYEILYRESALRDEVLHLQRLLGLDLTMELDVETFTAISCLMERIVLKSQGRGPAQGYKKNIFEVTNFSALNGKLQGVEISSQMMSLLQYVRGT